MIDIDLQDSRESIEIGLQDNRESIDIDFRRNISLNSNYLRLSNKPSVNGVELVGNLTSEELNLLSSNQTEYEEIKLESADRADFLLALGQDGQPKKLKLGELTSRTMQTLDEIPQDLEIGSYVFLRKEEI